MLCFSLRVGRLRRYAEDDDEKEKLEIEIVADEAVDTQNTLSATGAPVRQDRA